MHEGLHMPNYIFRPRLHAQPRLERLETVSRRSGAASNGTDEVRVTENPMVLLCWKSPLEVTTPYFLTSSILACLLFNSMWRHNGRAGER